MNKRIKLRDSVYVCANCEEILTAVVAQMEQYLTAGDLGGTPITQQIKERGKLLFLICPHCGVELAGPDGGCSEDIERAILHNEHIRGAVIG